MNGTVIGTMEGPMDVSPPSPPVNHKPITSKDFETVENHSGHNNDTENSNHINSEIQDRTENGNQENFTDNINEKIRDHKSDEGSNIKVTTQDHSSKDLINDCSISNESHSQTMISLHTESVTTEPNEMMTTLDEKNKNCENHSKVYNKTNPDDELRQCSSDEVDSEEDSSDEGSVVSKRQMAEDTLSVNSDSQPGDRDYTSQESITKAKDKDDIIILDSENGPASQNGNTHDSPSPEVYEITSDNDDCILESDEKTDASISDNKVNLRRSSRAVKTKKYDDLEYEDYESDVEEVKIYLGCKNKPIIINNTKNLVEMAAKQVRLNQSNEKKEPTVVIIDSNSGNRTSSNMNDFVLSTSNIKEQNLYQSIVARGTTVTPVSAKTATTSSTQSSPQSSQPVILPSLTDDMFVVEAPSFIVPYVYEKPSVKPFREFVDILGKELEQQIAKEKQEQLEKQKAEKEKREKVKNEKRERGEEVSDSEDDVTSAKTNENVNDEKNKKKRERRKQRNDDDDASWDGESSEDSEDETLSDVEVIKDKADSLEIKDVTHLTSDKVCSGKSDDYFDCSLGKFFIDIGLNLVQEYVQTDLLKHQNRKLYKEKKSGRSTKATQVSIASLTKNLEFSKENNAPYAFKQIKCEFCSFKTESNLVMNNHLETPHMKNNVYKCNYCEFEIRSPRDILCHMEAEHNVKGKLERAPSYHQCPNCTFEDNGKGKLARHQMACAKKFKPEINLAPSTEWEPPAKIPKIAKARNNMLNTYQNAFNRQLGNNLSKPITIANLMPPANIANSGFRPRGRSTGINVQSRSAPVHGAPIQRGGVTVRHNAPSTLCNYPIANNGKKSMQQPSISITPLPRLPQPQPVQQPNSSFVICEICDGYIKDLEQLRNHMQWIHKVKIHPKMIYNRPPLNCQKCQFRFFTDQGLERHLLGSHGLVTSSMHEAANKGKDAGRCPVCGRVYQWKLLNHVAKDHNLTLKPAHLSYKCTVCEATFEMYKHFENHVYSAHSVVAKRIMDKSNSGPASAKASNDLQKPLKINDEITIIPQPVKPATSSKSK